MALKKAKIGALWTGPLGRRSLADDRRKSVARSAFGAARGVARGGDTSGGRIMAEKGCIPRFVGRSMA